MKEYILLILSLLIFQYGNCLEKRVPRIAIIGGGIGGASASYFLTELFNRNLEIDLYEAKTIGGRLATIEIDNNEIETGGTIIHSKNMYMQKFVKLLGLEHRNPMARKFGIWNGDEFVYEESDWYLISMAKMLYRYGFQIFKLQRHVNAMLKDFGKIYDLQDAGHFFMNVSTLLSSMNKDFPRILQISVKDHLLQLGFTERLIDELVQSAVIVNYGQDVNVHSFVGSVSLAAVGGDLWSVKGGNKKVPEHLIHKNKNINVIPNYVTKIHNTADENLGQYEVTYTNKDSTVLKTSNYDIVIVAAPLTPDQEYPIEFVGFPKKLEFLGNYHTTHATFVKADIIPKYFGLQETLGSIFSCNFNKTIISSIGEVNPVDGAAKKNSRIWKIFSRESVDRDVMRNMFSNVMEKKEIVWKAYPHYSTNVHLNNFKLHDALYHVNAIEWAASAMEMSAIAGRNVAILAHDDFFRKYDSTLNKAHKDSHKKLHSFKEL